MIQQARRGGETLVRAELLVACMGASGRPVRLPPHLRKLWLKSRRAARPAHAIFGYKPLNQRKF